jgi:thiol-disulfide isomerase/thioredoxin
MKGEGQAVRAMPCIALMTVCLALTGCNALGKKNSSAPPVPRPSVDPTLPPRGEAPAVDVPLPPVSSTGVPSGVTSGILAGQVVDSFNGRPPQTYIEVSTQGMTGAPIEVAADGNGYFTIQGLQPGRTYQLTARAHDGTRLLAGSSWATPPNPKLLIRISEDLATRHTPPLPPSPAWNSQPAAPAAPAAPPAPVWPDSPAQPAAGTGIAPSSATVPAGLPPTPVAVPPGPAAPAPTAAPRPRAAEIGRPIQVNPLSPPPAPARPPAAPDPTHIVGPVAGRSDPVINMPNGPQPAATGALPGQSAQATAVAVAMPWPAAAGSVAPGRPPVPFCQLTGRQLYNFALNDLNGQPWEFRQHRGRLVLLDFWGTWCLPCQNAIPHLRILQNQYGPAGLEVIGIAYESGTLLQQIQRVNLVAGRLQINYRLLLGGDKEHCPVRTQFQVSAWPTLVLLDETGTIVWRSEGVDPQKWQDLDLVIRQRLGVR